MRFDRITLQNFRNIQTLVMEPDPGVNVIHGENAQGKTNLIEALWLFSGTRSFRGAKEGECIRFGENSALLEAYFYGGGRDQIVQLRLGEKKSVLLNGVKRASPAGLCGVVPAVVFSPVHLSLVKEGPALRRRFLDEAIGQLYPSYAGNLLYYAKALQQRTVLLRDSYGHSALLDMLDVWDQNLAKAGAQILKLRMRFVERLKAHACAFYADIAGDREKLALSYQSSLTDADSSMDLVSLRKAYYEALHRFRAEDLRQGQTTVGVHRDDLQLLLDGKSARQYGSQGQQRSCVLALKLAECGILEENTDERPVVLLDDVMSELDSRRRDYLLGGIEGRQVFITCCEEEILGAMRGGKSYLVRDGSLSGERE